MEKTWVPVVVMLWVCLLALAAPLNAAAAASAEDVAPAWTQGQTVVAGVVATATALCLVLVLVACMDCCNAEVDSTNHPAAGGAGGSGGKWGGGYETYGVTDTRDVHQGVLASSRPGGVVSSPSNQPLPYSMFPVRVPEQAGFAGYGDQSQAGAGAGAGGWGGGGYGGQVQQAAPQAGGEGGATAPSEEPPPSYSETVHTQYRR